MALPLFCHCFLDDFDFELFLGVHFLQSAVFIFLQFFESSHQRGVHSAKLGPSLVEGGAANAVLPAQLRDRRSGLSLFKNGDNLAIGES